MAGTDLTGISGPFGRVPIIKRGVGTLPDGRVVTLVIDSNSNSSTYGAGDGTDVAKIQLWLSNDLSRTSHTRVVNLTPSAAPASTTRNACASMAVSPNGTTFVAWQGVDNGLYVSKWTYSAGVFTFVSTQTVIAASAVTNKFRAVDIDVTNNDHRPIVAAYEAVNTTGQTAFVRAYLLRSDNTTWTMCFSRQVVANGQFIKSLSEDVSIAWRGDGIVSNAGRVLIYCTQTSTTVDTGDLIQEFAVNITSGSLGTVSGTWYQNFNAKNASGSRRAILFTLTTGLWLLAGVYGTTTPRFFAAKLTSGSYSAPSVTYAGYVSSVALSTYFKIDASIHQRTAWTATYNDNRLAFGFISTGPSNSPRIVREILFTYSSLTAANAKPSIDQVPRPLDESLYPNGTQVGKGPTFIYAGNNRQLDVARKYYNYVVGYGYKSTTQEYSSLRFVAEDTFNAPTLISPADDSWSGTSPPETVNRPIFRVRVDNLNLTPNLYGKLQVQVAQDSAFTLDVKTITQPDSAYQYFGSKDGFSASGKIVSVESASNPTDLYTGTWYWRARIVSDKDTPGEWSIYNKFKVLHPPSAGPTSPAAGAVLTPAKTYTSEMLTNGDFTAASIAPFFAFQSTVTYSTAQAHSGAGSARVVPDGTSSSAQIVSPSFPIDPGEIFTASAWIRPDTANKQVQVQVNYLTSADVYIATTQQISSISAGGWGKVTHVADTAAYPTAGKVQVAVSVIGTPAVGDAMYVDEISLKQTSGDVRFSWTFSDPEPSDQQTAYDLVVTRKDTGDIIHSSGWVTSTTKSVQLAISESFYELPLAWQVRLRDVDNTVGLYSNERAFTLGYAPTVEITAPADGAIVTTATPTLTWNYASSGGRTQRSYRITVADEDGQIVADTQWRAGAGSTYTFPTNVLQNSVVYALQVMVIDELGLYAQDIVYVTADWIEPALAAPVITKDNYKVTISWANATKDDDFISWRVYRKYMKVEAVELDVDNTANKWVMLYETMDDYPAYQYLDYTVPLNKPVSYLVVQVADRFGSVVESDLAAGTTVTVESDRYYFVPEEPVGSIASYESASVTGDNFTREIEQETLHVIDRGRQVQVGDDLGYAGTLTLKLRNPATARMNRQFLEYLSSQNNKVWIKTPFGDVVLCALGSVQTNRQAGYGGGDISDLSVPYLQVIAPTEITRES